jgi:hypothetical protein
MARYVGQEPNELTTLELPVVLRNSGPGRARIEFGHYLPWTQERQRAASGATRWEAAAWLDY